MESDLSIIKFWYQANKENIQNIFWLCIEYILTTPKTQGGNV